MERCPNCGTKQEAQRGPCPACGESLYRPLVQGEIPVSQRRVWAKRVGVLHLIGALVTVVLFLVLPARAEWYMRLLPLAGYLLGAFVALGPERMVLPMIWFGGKYMVASRTKKLDGGFAFTRKELSWFYLIIATVLLLAAVFLIRT